MKAKRGKLLNDEGSITPLITLYFVIIMSAIFLIANLASVYIARKELITVTEGALSKAAQELDEMRYYYSFPSITSLESNKSRSIPINCQDAARTFQRELSTVRFSHKSEILAFDCDGENLSATVSETHALPFEIPIFEVRQFTNEVRVSVRSIYG